MSRAVVDAKEFSHAMSKISKILKKCAIPILEEVCLRIQNGRCTLTATDLETWLTAELPASGDDMFFVFRKTKDILRACSHFAGELTMEFSETRSGSKKAGKILLRCERRGAEFEVYDGADYTDILVTQHFKLVLRKNHLRNIRFHDLRHTCASLLLKNGVPMKDIQEWLGHSSYNTTANIYAHLDTSSKNTSASKMSNVVIIEPSISTSI